MASYRFKLQKLLELKVNLEEEKKNQLGLAFQRLNDENEKLKQLRIELSNADKELKDQAKDGIEIRELKVCTQGIDYYKSLIKKQILSVKMADEYVEVCRSELIKASQDKKVMEKLKDKGYVKYLYTEQKKEDRIVDELVSFKQNN
jgi:flagellar export protein FliJ